MILIDYSQIVISNAMMHLQSEKNKSIDIDLLRHMILNSIRGLISKNRTIYGSDIVLAVDGRNSWRKSVFPLYKKGRKKAKEESDIDWDSLYSAMDTIKNELIEYSHYRVIQLEECEADDIIAILSQLYAAHQKILIVSGDSDFHQLQIHENIHQYSPTLKKHTKLSKQQARIALKHKIICGDKGDGIPNFLSVDNSFTDNIRQKSITQKNLDKWLNMENELFCVTGEMQRNWARNKMLIDFDEIPNSIREKVINTYNMIQVKSKKSLVKYFMEKQLVNLLECIDEF